MHLPSTYPPPLPYLYPTPTPPPAGLAKAWLRGAEWAGARGWSRESHCKASAPQEAPQEATEEAEHDHTDDQPPPSLTREPSLLPLLGSTLAALDQLPDEVLLEIMISLEVRSKYALSTQ